MSYFYRSKGLTWNAAKPSSYKGLQVFLMVSESILFGITLKMDRGLKTNLANLLTLTATQT